MWYSIALIAAILDQMTKTWITHHLEGNQAIHVFKGFDLILRYNRGASFSFLAEASGWQRWFFVGLAGIMSTILVFWLYKLDIRQKMEGFGLSLILGGAIGNLIDRLLSGQVTDFILLYYKHWQYPAFNIADSAICVGVGLLGFSMFQKKA